MSAFVGQFAALAQDVPSLLGTWKSASHLVQTFKGFGHVESVIEVTEQRGAVFSGTVGWQIAGTHGHDGARQTPSAKEKLIGVVGWDNQSVTLVEHGDQG